MEVITSLYGQINSAYANKCPDAGIEYILENGQDARTLKRAIIMQQSCAIINYHILESIDKQVYDYINSSQKDTK